MVFANHSPFHQVFRSISDGNLISPTREDSSNSYGFLSPQNDNNYEGYYLNLANTYLQQHHLMDRFAVENAAPDGNCFYHAMARLLNESPNHLELRDRLGNLLREHIPGFINTDNITHEQLRAVAVAYLRNNRHIVNDGVEMNEQGIDNYLRLAAQDANYAQTPEINALVLIFDIAIIVHGDNHYAPIRHTGAARTPTGDNVFYIYHANGNHFMPLFRIPQANDQTDIEADNSNGNDQESDDEISINSLSSATPSGSPVNRNLNEEFHSSMSSSTVPTGAPSTMPTEHYNMPGSNHNHFGDDHS